MSTTIDERVVEMRFDNQHFENNVSTTMSTLDKLKQSLNLTGASKGLENVSSAAKNCDMSGLSGAIDTVKAKFSALQVMGVTALANITNSAVNAGKRIVSALTIEPIKAGFQEYETQINSVQTILANTSHAGTDLQDVNRVLDELNEYADKTIYNFTQMTRNIGTFTAAGVDLETSAAAIQGIANLAAVSGSTSQQASTAMYQLSQAIANGKVNLQDWNSVVNAGMGGKVFQDALVKTAAAMKGVSEETFRAENITGSFRESINSKDGTGWLTSDILVKTLTQFTMAAEEGTEQWEAYKKSLMSEGYTETQAEEILKMANTATDAATKVKTFTQLWDTLKESAQSGWTQSWEIIIGDFEEAKEFLTEISDTIGGMLNESAEARNALLSGGLSSGWKQLLGAGITDEEEYIETIKSVAKEHGVSFDKMAKDNETFEQTLTRGLKEGKINSDILSESVDQMADKMSKMSAEELEAAGYTKEHVAQMKALSEGLKDGSVSMDEFVDKMMKPSGRENLIESLRNAFEGLLGVVKPIKEAFQDVFPAMTGDQLYEITENIKKFTEGLTLSEEASDKIKRAFEGLFSVCELLGKGIAAVVQSLFDLSQSEGISKLADFILDIAASIGDFFTSINEGFDTAGLTGGLSSIVTGISNLLSGFVDSMGGFSDAISTIGDAIGGVIDKIMNPLETVFNWLAENISISDIFAGLAGGSIFMAMKNFSGLISDFSDTLSKMFGSEGLPKWKDVLVETLGAVHEALDAFTAGLKTASIVGIAIAITLLASALKTISEVEVGDAIKSIAAIGSMMLILVTALNIVSKSLVSLKPKGFVSASVAMLAMAEAINILADAMTKISQLTLVEIGKGLLGIGVALLEISVAMRIMGKSNAGLANGIAVLALAESCVLIADALAKLGKMSWSEIGRGLSAMGGALAEFVAVIAVLGKVGGFKSVVGSMALLIAVESLDELAAGLKSFGEMSWDEIGRGLSAMGGALGELSIALAALGKIAGFSSIFASGAILIVTQSLDDIAASLKEFGSMAWDEIGRGLTAMGGALAELAVTVGVLGKLAGFSSIFGSGAILIVVQGLNDLAEAFEKFGSMSWDEIGRGLTGMGGALAEIGVVTGLFGKLAGFSGIIGSGTILLTIQGLEDLAESFKKFGEMSWDEIGRGLVGMGGALVEVGAISGALGYLTNLAGLLGAATIWTAIQGLEDLANAFQKFGEMSWDEIGRGLSAMGGALGEIALGGFLSTLSGIGAMAISEVAEPLGVLADSLKKWKDVTVPDDLGWQLTMLANGLMGFTFGGLGASTLATAAPAIGIMADSVKKWEGVTVPEELPKQISSLRKALSGFWTKGMSADVLATAAPAIGIMAESIKNWEDVTVPENLGDSMKTIAKGIQSFTFAFAGGWSLNAITGPLGELADDIKKWDGVTIPDGIGTKLGDLADGVQGFSFAFMGGWSLMNIVGYLGSLADDVKKWDGVTIPEGIGTKLGDLADGVQAFSFAFMGGWSLTAIAGPLGDFTETVKKWNGVTIPEDIGTGLGTLADGVKKFTFAGLGAGTLTELAPSIGILADSAKKWQGVTIPEGLGENLKTLATGVSKFSYVILPDNISLVGTLADSIKKWAGVSIPEGLGEKLKDLASAIDKLSGVKFTSISTGLDGVANALKDISSISISTIKESLDGLGDISEASVEKLISAFKDATSDAESAAKNVATSMLDAIEDKQSEFGTLGEEIMTEFDDGIDSKESTLKSTVSSIVSTLASTIEDKYDSFYSAGSYLVEGLAAGLSDSTSIATAAAAAVAAAAIEAAEEEAGIQSPSKEFYRIGDFCIIGFVNSLADGIRTVYKASAGVADSAMSGISDAIRKTKDAVDLNIDAQPTIRPVLDLSDVESGAGTINKMLNMQSSIGLLSNVRSINTMMNRRNQNGTTEDVISAIKDLKKTIGNTSGNTYTIGGITYSEGSEVSNAIEALVRAVTIERRV